MMSETDSRHGFNDLDHHVDILFDEIMRSWGARCDGGQIVDNGGSSESMVACGNSRPYSSTKQASRGIRS